MPLFELYGMTKEKFDSDLQKNPSSSTDLSFQPGNDSVELVWENGQILTQCQSSRFKNSPASTSLASHCLPSHTPKNSYKGVGNGSSAKMGKFGTVDSVLNKIHMPASSGELGFNQDDNMVPWLNYGVDESLQQDYCSDLLHEFSGVSGNNFGSFDKRSSSNLFDRELNNASANHDVNIEHVNLSKFSSIGGEATPLTRSSTNSLHMSSSQQCQTSFPQLRSRAPVSSFNGAQNSTDHGISRDSYITSAGSLSGLKMNKQERRTSTDSSGFMNFSHFAQPAALVRESLQNIGKMRGKDKSSVASGSPVESPLIGSSGILRKEACSHSQIIAVTSSEVNVKPQEAKPSEQSASEPPEAICREDVLNNNKKPPQHHTESETKRVVDSEKTVEPVVAASSVCSGNSVERASDDRPHYLKRKHRDPEDSECPSDDLEEESVRNRKRTPTRLGTGSKRSRAAEVHNLSERRRRDRINEKMRALQELIPNCNKVDKASMLDEAIEYLKTLQLQVQMMSMGAGLYMSPMMYPSGLQHMHAAHMAHFSPMGIGMGMGVGYGMGMPDMNAGSSCYPIAHVPVMRGAHFPGASVSGPSALQGMSGSNFQLFGLPGQGHPISMPDAPLLKSAMGLNASGMVGPMDNTEAGTDPCSKEAVQNVNVQVLHNAVPNGSVNQTSDQCEATKEGFPRPPSLQDNCQASEVTGLESFNSSSKSENESNKAACE